MKAQKFFYFTLFSLLSFEALSPTSILSFNSKAKYRGPASTETKDAPVKECTAELSGEQLQTDVQQLIKDKESILEEIQSLKKEKEILKKPGNELTVAMLSDLTSFLTAQMQQQMQMQTQMMNMINQMQLQSMIMPTANSFAPQFPMFTMNDSINFAGPFVGQPAKNNSPWSTYVNPYSMLPEMTRSEIPQHEFGFIPKAGPMRGFDFSLPQALPEMEKQEIPSPLPKPLYT